MAKLGESLDYPHSRQPIVVNDPPYDGLRANLAWVDKRRSFRRSASSFAGAAVRGLLGLSPLAVTGIRLLAFGPDGNLYVSSVTNNNILEYSGSTGVFLGTFVSFDSDLCFSNTICPLNGSPNRRYVAAFRLDCTSSIDSLEEFEEKRTRQTTSRKVVSEESPP